MLKTAAQKLARSSGAGESIVTRSKDEAMAQAYVSRFRPEMLSFVLALVLIACSGGSGPEAQPSTTPETVVVTVAETPDFEAAGDSTPTTVLRRTSQGPLIEVCPERVVVQAAGLPSPAVGPLYALLEPDATIDPSTQTVSGPVVRPDGTVEDVTLEIRAGGPAVGFANPLTLLESDDSILLAQVSTAVALRDAALRPSVGVLALTDRSHASVIVDPQTYPNVTTFDDIRSAGLEVRHVTDEAFIAFLASQDELASDQLVSGFDGEPAAFVQAQGMIAQQGDVLVDPALFSSLPQWNRPVRAIAAADVGWWAYDDALVVRPDDLDRFGDCLGRLIPVVQSAINQYLEDPQPVNSLMSEARVQFAPLSRLSAELMDEGTQLGIDSGVFVTGTTDTIGDFDMNRLDAFGQIAADVFDVAPVPAEDLVTTVFIDPEITAAS